MAAEKTNIGNAKMKEAPKSPLSFMLKDKAVKNKHLDDNAVNTRVIEDKAVTPEKLSSETVEMINNSFKGKTDDLQNQIDALELHGIAISNDFGQNTHIGISQKTLTEAINKVWQKIEEITGESLLGFNCTISPTYFISEGTETIHVTALPITSGGIFEYIELYKQTPGGEKELIVRYDNVNYFYEEIQLDDSATIICKAQILGIEYSHQQTVKRYNSFFLGGGNNFMDIMNVEHVIPVEDGMRGEHDITITDGQHIIIVMEQVFRPEFIRADINGVEIPFTESTATVGDKNYSVFISDNTYNAGTYNIDING